MPTLDKPTDPIETYLSEAGRELRRRLPAWMVDQRLAEAREHMTQCTEGLAAEGMPTEQAQATAVSAFGPAKEWVKSVAEAAYADSGAIKARRVAIGTGIVVMAATFFSLWGERVIIYHVCWSMFWLGLLMIAASAFRSRRSATPMLLAAAFIGAVALFLWAGATTIDGMSANMPVPRAWIATGVRVEAFKVADDEAQSNLLRLGLKTYGNPSGNLPREIPAELMAQGSYIVPKPLIVHGNRMSYTISFPPDEPWTSAFKVYTPKQKEEFRNLEWERSLLARIRITRAAPSRTVATEAEAAQEWRKWGKYWLDTISDGIENDRVWLANYRMAATHPNRFGWHWGADRAAVWLLIFAAPVALLDFLAAWLGRWAFRRRRAPLRRVSA